MDFRYIKSVFYLTVFTGLGVGLFQFCTKDDDTVVTSKNLPGGTEDPREVLKEKKNYLNILKASANSEKPLYRMSKAEIDAELNRK